MGNTIFFVEDDPNIKEVVEEYLKDAGFIVLAFDRGDQAKDMLQNQNDFDLFILDIMLPQVSGLELLHLIRKDSQAPVIMLTALEDEYTQLISFEGLADDYVTKPFSPKLLIKRVEALLRRSGKRNSTLGLGPISIDVDSYEAFENGRPIDLTLKEMEILKTMIQYKGKVLTRQQLLNQAWGYDYFGDERIVDVHIKNLRKKFTCNIITTVKGVGYKTEEI